MEKQFLRPLSAPLPSSSSSSLSLTTSVVIFRTYKRRRNDDFFFCRRAAISLEKSTEKLSLSSSSKKRFPSPGASSQSVARSERKLKTQNLNQKVSPHRAVAAVRLLRIDLGGAFAGLLNDKVENSGEKEMGYVERTLGFRTRKLEDRDIKLVTEIVGGAVRWRRYLDHILSSLCKEERTFREMEPLLLQILRIGAYEIVKLEMPTYAVVHENVELAKCALRPGAGNMVNGILRKLISLKEENSLPLPKIEGDDRSQARALAIIHSHPVWMVRRWIKSLGKEGAIMLMEWNNKDPSYSLRVNTSKGIKRSDFAIMLNTLKVSFEESLYTEDFLRVQSGMQAVIQAGFLKEGLCSVQDESAGLVVSLLDPRPGELIIDCCAAPGGKTLFMASLLAGKGTISAVDVNKGRLRILQEAASALTVDNVVETVHADLRTFAENNPSKSDKVLLDVPCSGLGVLSKRADLRWNRRLEDMQELKELQDQLLDAASTLVKLGGVLVYSTCSIDTEENEERVTSFLLRHPEFVVESAFGYVPHDFVSSQGFYFSNPIKHGLDGAFAARMVRCSESMCREK